MSNNIFYAHAHISNSGSFPGPPEILEMDISLITILLAREDPLLVSAQEHYQPYLPASSNRNKPRFVVHGPSFRMQFEC
jgi:hypothetical protein